MLAVICPLVSPLPSGAASSLWWFDGSGDVGGTVALSLSSLPICSPAVELDIAFRGDLTLTPASRKNRALFIPPWLALTPLSRKRWPSHG